MQYLTRREREEQWKENVKLWSLTLRYSIIGGALVWVCYNL